MFSELWQVSQWTRSTTEIELACALPANFLKHDPTVELVVEVRELDTADDVELVMSRLELLLEEIETVD